MTVFVPSVPGIEELPSESGEGSKGKTSKSIWKNDQIPEADILMSLMRPYSHIPYDMDMPQLFAVIFNPELKGDRELEPVRRDLLGDVEEIRYLNQKAWGANVALAEPGLYQFLLEGKPFWNEDQNRYIQQSAKVFVPVLSEGSGWDKAAAQGLEIVPLSRPYGLQAPALFTARLIDNGKGVGDVQIRAGRINTGKKRAPTRWHRFLETRTDHEGSFSLVLNSPGWWYCEAVVNGEPLKGSDGELKEVRKSAILWLYVDGQSEEKGVK